MFQHHYARNALSEMRTTEEAGLALCSQKMTALFLGNASLHARDSMGVFIGWYIHVLWWKVTIWSVIYYVIHEMLNISIVSPKQQWISKRAFQIFLQTKDPSKSVSSRVSKKDLNNVSHCALIPATKKLFSKHFSKFVSWTFALLSRNVYHYISSLLGAMLR